MMIQRDYLVEAPINDAWSFIRPGEHAARCLPAAKLGLHLVTSRTTVNRLQDRAPKCGTLSGTATFAYDDSARYGTIDAVGADRRETSRAKAQIEFSVIGGPGEPGSVVALWGMSRSQAPSPSSQWEAAYVGEELFGNRLAKELRAGKVTDDASPPEPLRLAEDTVVGVLPVKVGGRLQVRVSLGLFKPPWRGSPASGGDPELLATRPKRRRWVRRHDEGPRDHRISDR
jgi:carbon monoxide dehydrogenase subunit G